MAFNSSIEKILQSLALQDKVSLLAGKNLWETSSIPGKVPSTKLSDGPNGAKACGFSGSTSACFPNTTCVAATFDKNLARSVGEALGEEAHSKGVKCLLAPTICIHRHPLGGRNFESFSEDPLLTGKLASQLVQGLQSKNVAATVKHYAANEQETHRMMVDTIINERTLREIYLRPFEIVVKEANPWALMTAYNSLNGQHCDSNDFLLKKVLRGEWGWDGLVMSDWGGTNSTAESLNAGVDLEMPGPSRYRRLSDLTAAMDSGLLSEDVIDARVRSLLKLLFKVDAFNTAPTLNEAIDLPQHRALIRDVGARGAVLLKNDKELLPLTPQKVKGKKIALIGFAKEALIHGGGSAAIQAHYKITPWDALKEALSNTSEISFAKGARTQRCLPAFGNDENVGVIEGFDGNPGWTCLTYDDASQNLETTTHGHISPTIAPFNHETFHKIVEYVSYYTPKETGKHYFGTSGVGPTQVFIDEKLVYEQDAPTSDAMAFLLGVQPDNKYTYDLVAGTRYHVRIRTIPCANMPNLDILEGRPGLRQGLALGSEHDRDLLSEAVELAQNSDYAIVFTGHEPLWETEGQDQASFNLPRDGSQDTLVQAVSAVNDKVIVVNSTGTPVAMPWLQDVGALVQAWFGGQEAGNSIAEVLTGAVNPEGNLPVTFPKSIEGTPAYGNFPGTWIDGKPVVEYKEGVFVGYRYYDRHDASKVNFPFGHGLSYTTFTYSKFKVELDTAEALKVTVEVTNNGPVAGGTLVQIYAGYSVQETAHPIKSLVAFDKVRLEPGQSRVVRLSVDIRDLGFFDEDIGKWIVREGEYLFHLGRSAADIVDSSSVLLKSRLEF
ncbi:family 3 glycoside hydrolase [Fusarium oxysporum]|nr:family 3 glycoside hydrolase [Fusarium oxysporum]KAH7203010.1 family 3 glycoside hydrolase [Fusarium oxysporum]